MPLYNVIVNWQGYSRGETIYQVEADSEEDAMDNYYSGVEVDHFTVRDDTEKEVSEARLIKQEDK